MSRCISVANQKGGVGKTTTVINLGAALGYLGQRVLLVDFDPQGALSAGLGVESYGLRRTVYDALLNPDIGIAEVLHPLNDHLTLVPANNNLARAEVELIPEIRRELTLRRALAPVVNDYDFVLVDCPPSLSLLTTNGICASDEVIVPIQCEFFALRGLQLLLDNITHIQGIFNPGLHVAGILPTMYSGRTTHAREVLSELQAVFGDTVFDVVILNSIRFADASVAGQAILHYEFDHPGAQAYLRLARLLLAAPEQADG